MKSILRVIVSIFKTLIGIVNIILILVIVLNILNFILLKVQKRDYTTFLDYTYVIIESDEEYLGLEENDFLLTDLRKSAVKEDLILYQDNNNVEIGKVLEIGSKDIIVESKGTEVTLNKESIIGTVIKVIPILGNILNMILDSTTFWISVFILIFTSIIQTLLSKASQKLTKETPDLVKISQEDLR